MTDYEKLREEQRRCEARIREIEEELRDEPVKFAPRTRRDDYQLYGSPNGGGWVFEVYCAGYQPMDGEGNAIRVAPHLELRIDTSHDDGDRVTFHRRAES